MANYRGILTNNGKALFANASVNSKVKFSHIALGDGNGSVPDPDENRSALVAEKARVALNVVSINKNNGNQVICEAIIPSNIGGFTIRELGLYADNVLVVNSNYPATYKPNADEGTARELNIKLVVNVQNADVTAVYLDDSLIYATREWVKNNYIPRSDIINDLTSGGTDKPLSAEQGKTLQKTKVQLEPMPANQGAYMAWNKVVGLGRSDLVNHQGEGKGGFEFWNGKDNNFKSIAIIDENGNYSKNAASATKLENQRNINISGAGTGSAYFDGTSDIQITLTLANSGVLANSYGAGLKIPVINVNNKGLITSISEKDLPVINDVVTGGTTTPLSAEQGKYLQENKVQINPMPANQGVYMAWNKVGGAGRTDLVNHQGLGKGGFEFWNGKDNNFRSLAIIDENGNYLGNASTATKLQTARKINSVAFDGTSDVTLPIGFLGDVNDMTGVDWKSPSGIYRANLPGVDSRIVAHFSVPGGSTPAMQLAGIYGNGGLFFRAAVDDKGFTQPFERVVTENGGIAKTTQRLQNPRKINGVSFDGSSDISIQRIDSSNNLPLITSGGGDDGLKFYQIYNNGYPTVYGNLIHLGGNGRNQVVYSWSGDNRIYHRSKRDVSNDWTDFSTVAFLNDNVASATKLQNPRKINGESFDGSSDISIKRIESSGGLALIKSGGGEDGVRLYQVYNSGYPTVYGNLIHIGAGGHNQLVYSWSGDNRIYHRSRRDISNDWTDFSTVAFITDNVASASQLKNARKINNVAFDGTTDITIKDDTKVALDPMPANQGAYMAWNKSLGQGRTDIVNHKGFGKGGFEFWNGKDNDFKSIAIIDENGNYLGNSSTATKLQNPRKINGEVFDGSADINIQKIASSGDLPLIKSGGGDGGIRLYQVYNNGYPTPYGNVIHIGGSGRNQILCSWGGDNRLYHRSKTDVRNDWTDFSPIAFTTDNVASATKLQTARKINSIAFDGTSDVTLPIGFLGDVNDMTGVDWKAPSGIYRANLPGVDSRIVLHCSVPGGSTPAIQLAGIYGNGGLFFRSAVDDKGFTKPFERVVTENGGIAKTTQRLQNPRKINGVSFDGSVDITIEDDSKVPLDPMPANQGAYMAWNKVGGVGRTDFVNHQGLGKGGFDFWNGKDGNFSKIASIDENGNYSKNAASATKLENQRNINISGAVSGSAYFDGTSDITISTTAVESNLRVVTGNNYTITYDDYRRIAVIEMALWTNESVVNQGVMDRQSNDRILTYSLPITLKQRLNANVVLHETGTTTQYYSESREWLINVMFDGYRNNDAQTKLCLRFSRWTGSSDEAVCAHATIVGTF